MSVETDRMLKIKAAQEQAQGVLQLLTKETLVAAVKGEIDLNILVSAEMASRGLSIEGEWVGFPKAEAGHLTRMRAKAAKRRAAAKKTK